MKPRVFYGWYIVAVGFLANVASSFALASTLSIFLKPLTADLGISRGVFSLLRSGEGIIGACLAPLVGPLVDRHGGRWLMAAGAAIVGVVIAQWFTRWRGRAFALSSMGVGFAKVCMPVVAASLLLWLGWRQTWLVFGVVTMALLIGPALLVVRRSPREMGLHPDGAADTPGTMDFTAARTSAARGGTAESEFVWLRADALRTRAFWLLVITFGISSMGVTGLNLHVYSYVTDIGYSPVVAASVMSVIASMQLASPLAWGLLAERVAARIAAMLRSVVQAIGLGL